MYCHLRLPVPPLILGINLEAHNAPAYQISAKSDNLQMSYCDLPISNLGTLCHLGFDSTRISTILQPLWTHSAPTYTILAKSNNIWLSWNILTISDLSTFDLMFDEKWIFSKRELKFMFAICHRPSVCRL